jgi:hypothetical protein
MENEIQKFNNLESKLTIEANKKAFISQANVVRQDIDQLLMCLGANHDAYAIAQKMDQLGQNIADLYTCFHNATSVSQNGATIH